jgi:hypothetical protein
MSLTTGFLKQAGNLMEQLLEQPQQVSIEDIKKNPELITRLFLQEQDVSLILEKRGNQVSYVYLKTYGSDSIRILREAKAEHQQLDERGYTREQAFKEFEEAQQRIFPALAKRRV